MAEQTIGNWDFRLDNTVSEELDIRIAARHNEPCYCIVGICEVSAASFRLPPRRMKSTHPSGRPLAAPTASCASPYANPIANEVFAVLAAVVIGKRSMGVY